MQKNILTTLLLTTTLLSGPTFAAERPKDKVTTCLSKNMRFAQKAVPQRGPWEKFVDIVKENAHSSMGDLGAYIQGGKTLLINRDPGPFVVGLLNARMTAASREFFAPYLKKNFSNSTEEFDVTSLTPLVEKIQLTLCGMIEELLMKQESYAWDSKNNKALKIYTSKTVFRKLLEAIVPDAVPLKGVMISIADQSFIRGYTVNKLNEMTISYILHYYQQSTGHTLKQSLAEVINSFQEAKKRKDEEKAKQQGENHSETLVIEKKQEELMPVLEESSALKTYFNTIIQYYLRLSIEQVMLPTIEKTTNELISEITRKGLPSASKFDVLWKSWTFGGLACSSVLGNNLFSMGLGLPVGLAAHSLAHLGTKSVVDWTISTLTDHKDLWIQSYLNSLIPITKEIHSRYFLNPNPTALEREIFAQEYGEENNRHHQTFVDAFMKDLSKTSIIGRIFTGARSMAPSSDGHSSKEQQKVTAKNTVLPKLKLGSLLAKRKAGKELTAEEEQTLKNLAMYPSYSLMQEEAAIVREWSQRTAKEFAAYAADLKVKQKKAEADLIETYNLYTDTIPGSIAEAYQSLTFFDWNSLDFIEVQDIVSQAILASLPALTDNDLELLKHCTQDDEFIREFIRTHLKKSDTLESEKDLFKSEAFIKEMISTYAQKQYKDYISEHKAEIDDLEEGFGKGLSKADVIKLHQQMTADERERFIVKTSEAQADLPTLRSYVKELVKQNIPDLINHYVDQAFKVLNLDDFIERKLKEAEQDQKDFDAEIEAIKLTAANYKDLAQRGESRQVKLAIVKANYINGLFGNDENFGKFRDNLRPFVPNKGLRTTIYTNITNRIASNLLSQPSVTGISENSKEITVVEGFQLIEDDVTKNKTTNSVTKNERKGIILSGEEIVPFSDFFPAVPSSSAFDYKLILTQINVGHILNDLAVAGKPNKKSGIMLNLTTENLVEIYQKVVEYRANQMESPGAWAFKDAAGLSFLQAYSHTLGEDRDFFDVYEQAFQDLVKKREAILNKTQN